MIPERTISIPDLYTDLMTNAFRSKGRSEDRVGIEAEFFLLDAERLDTPEAQLQVRAGRIGLFDFLENCADEGGWIRGEGVDDLAPEWSTSGGSDITLEPGGQIEVSTPPMASVDEALEEVSRWESFLRERAERKGLLLLATGYNDRVGDTLPDLVIRKPRYLSLAEHYDEIGPWGRTMMRATCSTQVNVDFGPPERAMKRWRLALHLSQLLPILYSTTERRVDGRVHANFRSVIWRGSEACRSGLPKGFFGSDPVESYLDFALDATVIFVDDLRRGCFRPSRTVTFREWISGTDAIEGYPDLDDWQTHLSTLFPDVRPRGFIEVRSLDAMPLRQRENAVRTLVEALYSDARTDELLEIIEEKGAGQRQLQQSLSISRQGF